MMRSLTFQEVQKLANTVINAQSETEKRLAMSMILVEVKRLQAQHGMRLISKEQQ